MSVDARDPGPVQDTLQTMVSAIWRRSRAANEQRLAVLQAAYLDITDGTVGHQRALDAAREAHKLAGGLGSFGFSDASDAARTLEQFWRAVADRRPNDLSSEVVDALMAHVRRALAQPLPASFESSAASATPDHAALYEPPPMSDQARVSDGRYPLVADPDDRSASESRSQADMRHVDIVLIEDDATVSEVLARSFTEYGLSVQTFGDGEAALRALVGPAAAVRARVIVLDYDLPGFDGLAVLRQLRDTGVLGGTRVVMLSLTVSREAVARAIDAGASGYIAKPFHWKTVLERVQMCLDGHPPLFVIGPSAPRAKSPLSRQLA